MEGECKPADGYLEKQFALREKSEALTKRLGYLEKTSDGLPGDSMRPLIASEPDGVTRGHLEADTRHELEDTDNAIRGNIREKLGIENSKEE